MLMVSILCDRAGIIRGVTITAICLQMVIFIIRYPDIKPDTMIHPGARREEPGEEPGLPKSSDFPVVLQSSKPKLAIFH